MASNKGYFENYEVQAISLIVLSLGIFTGIAFGQFKYMKFEILKQQYEGLRGKYKILVSKHDQLVKSRNDDQVVKIEELSDSKFYHQCHTESQADVSFGNVKFQLEPKYIISLTKMTLKFSNLGAKNEIVNANAQVQISDDQKSYSITLPDDGSTNACVLFIPDKF